MAKHDAPILDLSTLVDRPKIKIDGEHYEILAPEELTVLDAQRFASAGERLKALSAKGDEAALKEAADIAADITDKIMAHVPKEVRDKLSLIHRIQVADAFMQLLQEAAPALREQMGRVSTTVKASTGEKRSPDSSASMAETPSAGSPESPSA